LGNASRFPRRSNRINCGARIGLFFDAHQALIGDFPAKVFVLTALLEVLFQKNGPAGIRHKRAGSRQQNIAGAILHLHTTAEKG
jgi:hypothetical protein